MNGGKAFVWEFIGTTKGGIYKDIYIYGEEEGNEKKPSMNVKYAYLHSSDSESFPTCNTVPKHSWMYS